jgi:hypothetical protein
MDKVPWVGNGWVQLPWVGYGYSCQVQCRTLLNTNKFEVFKFVLISNQVP